MTKTQEPAVLPDQPTRLETDGPNAVGRMLGLLGDEWTLLIVQQSLRGIRRYGQLMDALPISNSTLTSRLAMLTREGMLERHVYQDKPVRAEYRPTPRTRSLWPVLLAIWEWERHWVPDHAERLPSMHHDTCDADFAPVLGCRSCGRPVAAREIEAEWGPSGSWPRSVPEAATRRRSDAEAVGGQSGLFPDTMTIFGNRWSSALLGAAFRGLSRFHEFESALGAPPTLVAERLKAFVAIGVLEPVESLGRADWVQYRLTEKGRAFFPVVATSLHWAEQWFHAPEGPALLQTHRTCGQDYVPFFICDRCGEPLAAADISIVPAGTAATPPDEESR